MPSRSTKRELINSCIDSTTTEQQVVTLIEKGGSVTEAEVEKLYDALKPLPSPEFLIGSWGGGGFDTGHPGYAGLAEARWAGKDFRSVDDVDPIMVLDEKENRVWNEEWGHASVRCYNRSSFQLACSMETWNESWLTVACRGAAFIAT